jgi:AraC-like DNA-binding protein
MSAPQRSISDVAFACGFESLATFYRVFRAAQGTTPGDFRAQQAFGS